MTQVTGEARRLWLRSGGALTLGPPLAGATGEGVVYAVQGRPELAAKVFHAELTGLEDKLNKVAAMVQSPPVGAVQPDGFVVLAWPGQILRDERGPVGFVMPRIATATAVELHAMSNPTNRADPMPSAPQWTRNATWGHLVNVAANLCLAVETVHGVEAVIGDFQERNVLVSDTTRVTLVDCDSMQFADPTGRRFLCPVGRPEFTAPELARQNLREEPRHKHSDLFGLAVHIHQLLMAGNHPFLRGQWTGGGEQPDAMTLARTGDWAGGPNSRLLTHPLAPPVSFLPSEIQQFFVRAFTVGATDPSARPTAEQWRAALSRVRLTPCGTGAHQVPAECLRCPWCAIDRERAARRRSPVTSSQPRPTLPVPAATEQQVFGLSAKTYLSILFGVVLAIVLVSVVIIIVVLS